MTFEKVLDRKKELYIINDCCPRNGETKGERKKENLDN